MFNGYVLRARFTGTFYGHVGLHLCGEVVLYWHDE
jgi:hypothetical protein